MTTKQETRADFGNSKQLQAQLTMQAGCPRTADVKAARNALYLASIGKAGGLGALKIQLQASATVAQHQEFQAARRFLAAQPYIGPARQPYKRQQRPA